MTRFIRQYDPQVNGPQARIPFDPSKHRIAAFDEPGLYPSEAVFAGAEEVYKRMFEENPQSVCLIQRGMQQGIFEVLGRVGRYIAGVSLAPEADAFVRQDHEVLGTLRAAEAAEWGLELGSEEYGYRSTFARHFVERSEAGKPFAYLGEFCEGFVEVNARYVDNPHFVFAGDSTQRRVLLNGLNQNVSTYELGEEESGVIFGELAEHQLRNAVRSGRILAPAFRAGDYMYHPDQRRVMLQCYRAQELAAPNGIWMCTAEAFKGKIDADPKALSAAYQLLELIMFKESNLVPVAGQSAKMEFFTYSFMSISQAVNRLKADKSFLSSEQWKLTLKLVHFFADTLLSGGRDPVQVQKLHSRFQFVLMMLQFG